MTDKLTRAVEAVLSEIEQHTDLWAVDVARQLRALLAPREEEPGVRDELVRSVHRASRHIWALSAPEHGMMMVRADDAERIMREEILGETSESPQPPQSQEAGK